MPTVAFLGTGSMNGAIASGLLASGFDPAQLRATVSSEASAQKLQASWGEGPQIFAQETQPEANQLAVTGADLVLLGVKPYAILDLARQVAPHLGPQTLVVSVAAGIELEALESALPAGQPAVRCMPNTPSRVGKGVLAISPNAQVSPQQKELVSQVLSSVGLVIEVAEGQMGAVTAVSGSGPAYAFLLAETMAAAGVKLGLEEETAQRLAAATVAGAGFLLDTQPDPAALRRAVTSPNGTTEAALKAYTEGGIYELTQAAMEACVARNKAMVREFSQQEK